MTFRLRKTSLVSVDLSLPNVINPYRSQLRLYISHIQLSLSLLPLSTSLSLFHPSLSLPLSPSFSLSHPSSFVFDGSKSTSSSLFISLHLKVWAKITTSVLHYSVYIQSFCFPWFGVTRNGIKEVRRRRKGSLQPSVFFAMFADMTYPSSLIWSSFNFTLVNITKIKTY